MKGIISEWLQIDTIELNLRFTKIFLFSAVDPLSKLYYLRAYHRATSFNARDFLFRLTYLHNYRIKYLQIDNGSEWEKYFVKEVEKRNITLVYNYPKSPKMNAFVERVNGTVQTEYLGRFYEETSVNKINEILYDCLIEYNFYRPHRSLNLLTPIEYCSKLNNRDAEMVQMYWTQTISLQYIHILIQSSSTSSRQIFSSSTIPSNHRSYLSVYGNSQSTKNLPIMIVQTHKKDKEEQEIIFISTFTGEELSLNGN